jgi:hypothetical protein
MGMAVKIILDSVVALGAAARPTATPVGRLNPLGAMLQTSFVFDSKNIKGVRGDASGGGWADSPKGNCRI